MNLNEYYHAPGREGLPQKTLDNLHGGVLAQLSRRVTQQECDKLQTFFNAVFYPEKYGGDADAQKYHRAITQLINQAYQQEYDTALNNFDIGSAHVSYGVDVNNLEKLIRDRYESFSHKEKIYKSTIKTRLNKVQAAIENSGIRVKSAEDLTQYENDLLALEANLKSMRYFKGIGSDKNGQFYDLTKGSKTLIQRVKDIDAQYQALSEIGGVFTSKDFGQVLEWVLQAFDASTEPIIEDVVDDLISKELLEKAMKTSGSATTGKDGIKITLNTTPKKKNKDNIKKQNKEFSISDGEGNSFSFKAIQGFQPDSDRQGKMDVNFTFNDNGTYVPFRISAKNWQGLSRDFGNTNIIHALIRSLDIEGAELYTSAMTDEGKAVQDANDLAKYAIIVDILMGYSQKNNYADTLFINDRIGKSVYVISLVDLFEKIYNNIAEMKVGGYDNDTIETKLKILKRAVDKSEGESYRDLAWKYLQTVSCEVHFRNITPYLTQSMA